MFPYGGVRNPGVRGRGARDGGNPREGVREDYAAATGKPPLRDGGIGNRSSCCRLRHGPEGFAGREGRVGDLGMEWFKKTGRPVGRPVVMVGLVVDAISGAASLRRRVLPQTPNRTSFYQIISVGNRRRRPPCGSGGRDRRSGNAAAVTAAAPTGFSLSQFRFFNGIQSCTEISLCFIFLFRTN